MLHGDLSIIAVIAILALSAFVRAAIGFGDALIAMGIVTAWVGLQTTTPLVALMSLTISLSILLTEWRRLNLRAAFPLIVSSMLGIPFGLALLKFAPEPIAKMGLGIILIAYGAYGVSGLTLPTLTTNRLASLFGFVAGILGGAYNTSGPIVVVYGTLKRWRPDQFRLTLQGYFFFSNLLVVTAHALSGLWTTQVWQLFLFALPAILVGVWLGGLAHRRIPGKAYEKAVFAALLVIGVVFVV